ncbi:hypothetical protein [Streptococcus porci]|uniref:hypothetical protein n=1 Tax=Streptococcus porci TaxID=502567 RepID=UPI000415279F|nr:hypothetical protein [Streptococcus porci]
MKKRSQKLATLAILGITISPLVFSSVPATQVLADENTETVNVSRTLTESETQLVDQFVTIKDNRFVLNEENTLSKEVEYLAKLQIADTNFKISQAEREEGIFTNSYNKTIGTTELLFRSPGKNAIEFYWNYVRIYIDANNLSLALQAGFAIGGIYAPSRAVEIACALLGIGSSQIKDGIWFDFNYLWGGVNNAGFQ